MLLDLKKIYLEISLNSNLSDACAIIRSLPKSDRIIIEAGTPLIKEYGTDVIRQLYNYCSQGDLTGAPYIVADLKTMDRAATEVQMVKLAGASAAVCLGQASLETINSFVESCEILKIDSMLDMMNIEYPVKILRQLKKQPNVIILHRGVDEEKFNKNKPIPYVQINKVLSSFNVLISIAGGDSSREVQRAIFNGANIVVVWKEFYQSSNNTNQVAVDFLREIK